MPIEPAEFLGLDCWSANAKTFPRLAQSLGPDKKRKGKCRGFVAGILIENFVKPRPKQLALSGSALVVCIVRFRRGG